MKVIHIMLGGPIYKLMFRGKVRELEDHRYCGPSLLNQRTRDPLLHQPMDFLEIATKWAQQGRRVDKNGFCVWK